MLREIRFQEIPAAKLFTGEVINLLSQEKGITVEKVLKGLQ
jgi:hypothetical protein